MTSRLPTGIRRLDDLLQGGLAPGAFALLYGPPFVGKDVLARQFVLAGLRNGEGAVLVLTNDSASHVRQLLAAMDRDFESYESSGRLRFIDAYSRSLGIEESEPNTEYVDTALNLNGLSVAVMNAERKVALERPVHRLVLDSVSTLVAYTNAQTTFRFLQVLIGKTRMAGATGLLLLDDGMHAPAEVQTIKHLMSGVLEFRLDQGRTQLKVEGVGLTNENPGWVDYRYSEKAFEITGSFAAGRIR